MSEQKKEVIKTKVGGQALIEGVMMLGPKKGCMAMMPWAKTYSYMCALFYVPLCTIFIFRNAMQGLSLIHISPDFTYKHEIRRL